MVQVGSCVGYTLIFILCELWKLLKVYYDILFSSATEKCKPTKFIYNIQQTVLES